MKAHPPERLLEVRDLEVVYRAGNGRRIHAVSGVSFGVAEGETLGLVGESGCGKSSLARAVMQCPRPTAGEVRLCGEDLGRAGRSRLRALRPTFQMLFQDAAAALNPKRGVGASIAMPLRLMGVKSRGERRCRVEATMTAVGLDAEVFDRRPSQLSGGQCQRVQIARALVTAPRLLVCDEPVSALDVSIQAKILNLLADIRAGWGLTLLFISHDLAVVEHISDRVAVMYMGKLCEVAPTGVFYDRPAHPYSKALLSALPGRPAGRGPRDVFRPMGEMPSPLNPPSGCRYRTRCPLAHERCAAEAPVLRRIGPQQRAACHCV